MNQFHIITLPHFYNDSLKRKSLSDNYKLYMASDKYNQGKLDEIKLYEPTNYDKYLKLDNKLEYKKNIKFKKMDIKNNELKKLLRIKKPSNDKKLKQNSQLKKIEWNQKKIIN